MIGAREATAKAKHMLSDTLHEAERAIAGYLTMNPSAYAEVKDRIDRLRCEIITLKMELESSGGPEHLADNPVYEAAKRGDPTPHDLKHSE
jgi:hypothetical protein